jgi:serine/threonine protein kinase
MSTLSRFLGRQIWFGKMLSRVYWLSVISWLQSGTLLWWVNIQICPVLEHYNLILKSSCFWKVRFFYSFTSRENLYLVMEYLNGGDLYSLLRNLGCLDEDVARVYLAEVVSLKYPLIFHLFVPLVSWSVCSAGTSFGIFALYAHSP